MTARLTVGCDLFLDLKLYRVPDEAFAALKAAFPAVDFRPVNIRGGEPAAPLDTEIYWGNRITRDIIAGLPRLKWIHFGSVGVNRAHVPEVQERSIIVTNSRDSVAAALTASALALMLALARGLHHCWRLQAAGNLSRESFDAHFDETQELEGQTCVIVGYGQVGRRLARALAALGVRIVAISRSGAVDDDANVAESCTVERLREAVSTADYVVNLLPLTPATAGVFDRAVFAAMRPTGFFVNVGRGETVREPDLIDAVERRVIAGAALDVFEKEPLAADSPLWKLPRVIVTPHIGGLTNRYWTRQCRLFANNLRRYLANEPLLNRVDMAKGY